MKKSNNKQIVINSKNFFKIQKDKKNTSMPNYHSHDKFEIYYLCSGERYYFIKDKTYHVKKGNLVLINEYDIHCTKSIGDAHHKRIVLNFNRSFLEDFAEKTDVNLYGCFENNINVIELNDSEQIYIESLLNTMIDEYSTRMPNYMLYLQTAVIQLLLFANRHSNISAAPTDIFTNHKVISKAIGYINQNYSDNITLESISERYFLSTYYFSRKFKEVTNISFVDYLNNVRIKEAKELLVKTDFNVTQICEMVGYNNATHFGRVFKKITSISPSEYQKLHKQLP